MAPISSDGSFSQSSQSPPQELTSHEASIENAPPRQQLRPYASVNQALGITDLLYYITNFIRSDSFLFEQENLVLSVSPSTYLDLQQELDHPRILTGKEADSLRYDYSPETSTLTVSCMPTPVHDAISGFVDHILLRMLHENFLSFDERLYIMHNSGVDVGLPTLQSLSRASTKGGEKAPAKKQPDAAIYFIDEERVADSDLFPRVVFEAASSQPYESLLEDARHWLLRTEGEVKLVVVVKLFEGKRKAAGVDNEETRKEELEQQLGGGGEAGGVNSRAPQESNASHSEGGAGGAENTGSDQNADIDTSRSTPPYIPSQPPTANDYKTHFQSDPSPWVGPITGFIELYRYDAESKSMFQDGSRCDIFSDSDNPPRIRIADLLPHSHISGDPSRTFPLPLENYRNHIARETRKLATIRISHQRQQVRKRKERGGSSEYGPGEGGEIQGQDERVEGEEGPRRSKRGKVG